MIYILYFLLINKIICNNIDISLFKNQICSYNGKPQLILENEIKYICECDNQFETDNKVRTIFGHKVYCSYKKKSKLKTLFLAIFFPFGINYFYLGYIVFPIIILLYSIFVIICNCIFIYKIIDYDNKINENEIEIKENYDMKKMCIFIKILDIISVLFYILNIILILSNVIIDSYGKELYNDIYFYNNK